jgi:hypothetical protein
MPGAGANDGEGALMSLRRTDTVNTSKPRARMARISRSTKV